MAKTSERDGTVLSSNGGDGVVLWERRAEVYVFQKWWISMIQNRFLYDLKVGWARYIGVYSENCFIPCDPYRFKVLPKKVPVVFTCIINFQPDTLTEYLIWTASIIKWQGCSNRLGFSVSFSARWSVMYCDVKKCIQISIKHFVEDIHAYGLILSFHPSHFMKIF